MSTLTDFQLKYKSVTTAEPCPVCAKPDWCAISRDGTHALCQRIEEGSSKRYGNAGWLHQLKPSNSQFTPQRPKDWQQLATQFAGEIRSKEVEWLAARLGIPVDAFAALPLIGVTGVNPQGTTFSFPEVNASGNVIGLNCRYPDGSKKCMRGSTRGLTLPVGWQEKTGPVFVVEGASDSLAMSYAGLSCVGRPSSSGGVKLLEALFRNIDKPIIIVGENDEKPDGLWPGRSGARSVAKTLAKQLRRSIAVAMPPESHKDVRAWLIDESHGEASWPLRGERLRELLMASCPTEPDEASQRQARLQNAPRIMVAEDEFRVNTEAEASLGLHDQLFTRGGLLVQVIAETKSETSSIVRDTGTIKLRALPKAILREHLSYCAEWVQVTGGEEPKILPAHPPNWCVDALLHRGQWPSIKKLQALLTHPVVLQSGAVLIKNGYDAASGLYLGLCEGPELKLSNDPSQADAIAAVLTIDDVIGDFPFHTPAHRSAWYAGLLTPLAWFSFNGPAPLFLIDGNTRGCGKGLLADVMSLILTGKRFPVMTYSNDRDELRKSITALAIEGDRQVLIDNIAGAVGNDVLDAALTSTHWKNRILGTNTSYDGPLDVIWYATGNNVQLAADTSRRVCHIRLESPEERPEVRNDMKYANLRAEVLHQRGRLLSAALTIIKAWFIAGQPKHGLATWGSYEGWSGVIREALVFAGLPDPGETRIELQSVADRDANTMTTLLKSWQELDPDNVGLRTAEIVKKLDQPNLSTSLAEMREAVEELCGKLDSIKLGYKLKQFKRRNFDGRMLDNMPGGQGRNRWMVVGAKSKSQATLGVGAPAAGGQGCESGHGSVPPTIQHGGQGCEGGQVPLPLTSQTDERNELLLLIEKMNSSKTTMPELLGHLGVTRFNMGLAELTREQREQANQFLSSQLPKIESTTAIVY